jgi:hypothetical protein
MSMGMIIGEHDGRYLKCVVACGRGDATTSKCIETQSIVELQSLGSYIPIGPLS